jgi:predicted transcriptional regulator
VSNNPLPAAILPDLIASIHASLSGLSRKVATAVEVKEPAVNPKRSVHAEYIACLEDGKKFKALRRHLGSEHGMTPEAYRTRWELPGSYPMTAPSYSESNDQHRKKRHQERARRRLRAIRSFAHMTWRQDSTVS